MRTQIDEAKRLLLGTQMSVKAVSLRTGFQNWHYFSKIFRLRVGLAPGQFRDAHRAR